MITLLAATGYTGQLIAQELVKRGLNFQIAGRNKERLSALASRLGQANLRSFVVDLLDEETLIPALAETRVLINCAGPFTELGMRVVQAAAERGIHYLDTTGEQAFIKTVYERYDSLAQRNGSVIMPACAFEYAIGDAAAALVANEFSRCDEISIYYTISGFGTSRGTKKSILHALVSPSYFYRAGKFVEIPSTGEERTIEFPKIGRYKVTSFGGGEVISLPRHVTVDSVSTFINVGKSQWLLKVGVAALSMIMKTPLSKFIFNRIDSQPLGPAEQERKGTAFTILCEARAGAKVARRVVSGRDPYGLTALINAATAARLIDADKDCRGFNSAASLFGAEMIQRITESAGVEWQ